MDTRQLQRAATPSYGPNWDAAIEAGVDVALLDANAQMTPEQRLEQLQRTLDMLYELRKGMDEARASDNDAAAAAD